MIRFTRRSSAHLSQIAVYGLVAGLAAVVQIVAAFCIIVWLGAGLVSKDGGHLGYGLIALTVLAASVLIATVLHVVKSTVGARSVPQHGIRAAVGRGGTGLLVGSIIGATLLTSVVYSDLALETIVFGAMLGATSLAIGLIGRVVARFFGSIWCLRMRCRQPENR